MSNVTADASPSGRARAATTPAGWSPGVASAGTETVKGTVTEDSAATSTRWVGPAASPSPSVIHAPPSAGVVPAGSRSNCPSAVTTPSLAYTSNVAGWSLKLVTVTWSLANPPGSTVRRNETRPSGPSAVAGSTAHVVFVAGSAVAAAGSGP